MSDRTRPDTPAKRPIPSAFETVAGDMNLGDRAHAGGSSATAIDGGKKQKICCSCGKDVAHEERFKDRAGHYWCAECGVQEHRTKHTLAHPAETFTCPDCSQTIKPEQAVEFEGLKLCAGCVDKRRHAAEREATRQAARKAAVAQEFIDGEKRRRRILLISAIAAVVAIAFAIYIVAF